MKLGHIYDFEAAHEEEKIFQKAVKNKICSFEAPVNFFYWSNGWINSEVIFEVWSMSRNIKYN